MREHDFELVRETLSDPTNHVLNVRVNCAYERGFFLTRPLSPNTNSLTVNINRYRNVRKITCQSALLALNRDFPLLHGHFYAIRNLNDFGDFGQPHQKHLA